MKLALVVAIYATQVLVAALAWPLARRHIFHRPFARLATLLAVVDLARGGLGWARSALPWLGRAHPLHGTARVAYELDVALWWVWPVGLALTCWLVFARRPWGNLLGAVALVEVAAVALYPASRASWVRPAEHVAALLVAWVAVGIWARRREWPTPTDTLLGVALATETVCAAIEYGAGTPRASHVLTLSGYLASLAATAAIQAAWARHRGAA